MNFKRVFEESYFTGLFLKFLDGASEFISGVFLLFIPLSAVSAFVKNLLSGELTEDPKDFLANNIIHLLSILPKDLSIFWPVYFMIHGVIKLWLVWGLWQRKVWIYPWAIGIMTIFLFYQIYTFITDLSLLWLFLILVDIVVISFIIWDYKKLRKGKI